MPGARTHDAITAVTGLALAPVSYSMLIGLGLTPESAIRNAAVVVGAHLLSGIMFSPDLDIDSAIDNRWGIFFWIWRPYMWVVPHRSRWLSHGLILPPLLRLLYFYAVVVLLFLGCAWALGRLGVVVPDYHIRATNYLLEFARAYPRTIQAFLAGFVTGGAAHSVADWLVTGGKQYLRRLGFRITVDYRDHDQWRPYHRRRERSWER
jgi:uncharacterized metal-binding protein